LIPAKVDVLTQHIPPAPSSALRTHKSGRSPSENCAKIKELGFTASKHINMYGERFELVSDPFNEGDCTAVRVISGSDPVIRILRLPVSILVGLSDRFPQNKTSSQQEDL
jgi:hypothetical protein